LRPERASEDEDPDGNFNATLSFLRSPSVEFDDEREEQEPPASKPPRPWHSDPQTLSRMSTLPAPPVYSQIEDTGEREARYIVGERAATLMIHAPPLSRPPASAAANEEQSPPPQGPRTLPGAKALAAQAVSDPNAKWSWTTAERDEQTASSWAGESESALTAGALRLIEGRFEAEGKEREALAQQFMDFSQVIRRDVSDQLETRLAAMAESIERLANGREEILTRVSGLDDGRNEVAGQISRFEETLKALTVAVDAIRKAEESRPKAPVDRRGGSRFALAWSRAMSGGDSAKPERDALSGAEDLAKSGLLAEATAALEAAQEKLPHSVALLLALAQARLEGGDRGGARSHFQNAARLAPGSMEAQIGLMATAAPSRASAFSAGIAAVSFVIAAVALVRAPTLVQLPAPTPVALAAASANTPAPVPPSSVAVAIAPPPPLPAAIPSAVVEAPPPLTKVAAIESAKPGMKSKKAEGPSGGGGEKVVKKGEAALRSGKIDVALAAFGAALHDNPQLPGAHRGMAMVLMMQGKEKDAKKEYQTYLQLAPKAADANRINQLISEM